MTLEEQKKQWIRSNIRVDLGEMVSKVIKKFIETEELDFTEIDKATDLIMEEMEKFDANTK